MAKKQASETTVRDLEDFEDILSLTASDVKEPDLYPEGPWAIRNIGFSTSDVTNRDGDPQLLVNLRYEGFEPGEEVDPELIEAGGFEGKTLWVKRYISKPAAKAAKDGTLSRFVKFVSLHGVEVADDTTLTDMLKGLKGQIVSAQIGTRTYETKDGDSHTDNTVTSIAAIEA